jgi:hypothetical protein
MRPLHCIAIVVALASCGGGPQGTTVQRINPNAQVDLSGNWNDTDANQTARVMIQKCLTQPWAQKFKQEKGRDPVIRLSLIRNRSSEHINTRFFTKQVEKELLNSGTAKVVADREEAEDQRDERADQARHASDKTVKAQQQETGSDFLLTGWINYQPDAEGGVEVRAYQITMELINSESNEKVWLGEHQIKKVVNRPAGEW